MCNANTITQTMPNRFTSARALFKINTCESKIKVGKERPQNLNKKILNNLDISMILVKPRSDKKIEVIFPQRLGNITNRTIFYVRKSKQALHVEVERSEMDKFQQGKER